MLVEKFIRSLLAHAGVPDNSTLNLKYHHIEGQGHTQMNA